MGKISIKLVNKKILPFGKLRMRYANFRDIELKVLVQDDFIFAKRFCKYWEVNYFVYLLQNNFV